MTSGIFHYGTLSTSVPGELTIAGADGPTVVRWRTGVAAT